MNSFGFEQWWGAICTPLFPLGSVQLSSYRKPGIWRPLFPAFPGFPRFSPPSAPRRQVCALPWPGLNFPFKRISFLYEICFLSAFPARSLLFHFHFPFPFPYIFFFYFYSRSQRLQLSFLLDFVLRVERAEWSLLPLGGILLLLIITLASPLARSGGKCQVVVKFAT